MLEGMAYVAAIYPSIAAISAPFPGLRRGRKNVTEKGG